MSLVELHLEILALLESQPFAQEKQGLVLVLFLVLFVIGVPLMLLYCMPPD